MHTNVKKLICSAYIHLDNLSMSSDVYYIIKSAVQSKMRLENFNEFNNSVKRVLFIDSY